MDCSDVEEEVRLIELHPEWMGAGGSNIFNADGSPSTLRHGIGMTFDCPAGHTSECAYDEACGDGKHERHYVMFANPVDGGPVFEVNSPKWTRTGDTWDTLQLLPSILSDPAKGGCGWHGYIGIEIPGEVTTV